MLRKLLILGVCAGTSASVPILYQNNREAVHTLLESARDEAAPPAFAGRAAPAHPTLSALSGRRERIAASPNGHFLAEFRMNGRRIPAMVDTGATFVALNRSTARRIGIALAPGDFNRAMDTANGTTHAAAVMLARVELGRISVENVEAVVLDDGALNGVLIGMSFLQRLGRYGVEDGALLLSQ